MNNKDSTLLTKAGAVLGSLALCFGVASAEAQDTTGVTRDTTQRTQAAADTTADTTEAAGYQAMEPSAAEDTLAAAGDTVAARDTLKDTTAAGGEAEVQNPPGYRGMERPVNVFPPDTGAQDTAATGDATSRVNQMERQDTISGGEDQNPPGYRGMERPAALDSAQQQTAQPTQPCPPTSDEAGMKQKSDKKKKKKSADQKRPEQQQSTEQRQNTQPDRETGSQEDTASTTRVGQDTTGDTTRYDTNAQERGSTSQE